jgi:hypothetical protein
MLHVEALARLISRLIVRFAVFAAAISITPSSKQQATSNKQQATSNKQQATYVGSLGMRHVTAEDHLACACSCSCACNVKCHLICS